MLPTPIWNLLCRHLWQSYHWFPCLSLPFARSILHAALLPKPKSGMLHSCSKPFSGISLPTGYGADAMPHKWPFIVWPLNSPPATSDPLQQPRQITSWTLHMLTFASAGPFPNPAPLFLINFCSFFKIHLLQKTFPDWPPVGVNALSIHSSCSLHSSFIDRTHCIIAVENYVFCTVLSLPFG